MTASTGISQGICTRCLPGPTLSPSWAPLMAATYPPGPPPMTTTSCASPAAAAYQRAPSERSAAGEGLADNARHVQLQFIGCTRNQGFTSSSSASSTSSSSHGVCVCGSGATHTGRPEGMRGAVRGEANFAYCASYEGHARVHGTG